MNFTKKQNKNNYYNKEFFEKNWKKIISTNNYYNKYLKYNNNNDNIPKKNPIIANIEDLSTS